MRDKTLFRRVVKAERLKRGDKMKRKLFLTVILVLALAVLCSCSPQGPLTGDTGMVPPDGIVSDLTDENYQYGEIIENNFVSAAEQNSSYFSLDRNTASYTLMRRQIEEGLTVGKNSVRLEEYVNYFNYNYQRPQNGQALAVSGSLFDCPWNSENKLFTIGVAAEEISFENPTQNNLVFLIDTSGSMYGDDRLGLIQQAFTMLLENLADNDYVSIVTYAGDCRVALDGARGTEKTKIANVLQDLEASGSTNGSGGIQLAYEEAAKYFVEGGNNRVILATDGDFNVGISNKNQLKSFISEKRNSGIYLSVLGVGMFNTNDTTMKTLAENGNGNYAYLDSVAEARKVLVEEINGTFNVVAKDAKIGVVFNADVVDSYRLIGYESKMMSQEEFDDEQKDAGEIGSGHTVTAVYEVKLKENASGEVATAELRYKNPQTEESQSITYTCTTQDYTQTPDEDSVFIGCVVEYGLLLRQSQYKGDASFQSVIQRLETLNCVSTDQFKAEFLTIVQKAARLYE